MPDTKAIEKAADKVEDAGTEWQVEDFLFGEKSISNKTNKTNNVDNTDKTDNADNTDKTDNTDGVDKTDKTDKTDGIDGTDKNKEVKLVDQVKDKTQEEIDDIVDLEVNKRLEGTAKTKEEVITEINNELSGVQSEVDFSPFFDLLHKELGYKDIAKEEKPANSIQGFVDHLKAIIDTNSRPEYSSDIVKKFDDHVRNGYDPKKYLEQMYGEPDYEKMKVETESEQKAILDHYYRVKNPDWDTVKRTEKINRIEAAGILEDDAIEAHEELKKLFANREERINQESKIRQEEEVKKLESWKQNLYNEINTQSKIAGFDFPEQDKKGLFDFITKVNDEGITEYNKRLADPIERLKLAYYAFKGLDKKNFDSAVETDITQKLMKSLSRFTDTSKAGGGEAGAEADKVTKPGVTNYEAFIIN